MGSKRVGFGFESGSLENQRAKIKMKNYRAKIKEQVVAGGW